VGSLHLPVELRRSWFDINMSDPLIFYVPVEVRLKFMPAVCTDGMNAKRELLDHVINEIDGTFLVMTLVDSQSPKSCGIIDGGVLKAADLLPINGIESQKLNVHLDVMARDLFCVSTSVKRPTPYFSRQAPQAMSNERTINART
jgi:hypothetical protein